MRLKPEQLAGQLKKGLAPLYFITGDEPLIVQEATDQVRTAARAGGYTEREVMAAEGGFDWHQLLAASDSLSLFGDRRIIELRMPSGKPGDAGSKALQAYAGRPADDAVLIVTSGKLESAAQRSKWFTALDQAGVVVQVWPVDTVRLPAWISERAIQRGIRLSPEAVALLVERVEGNLLAAAQEIDKLLLLHGPGTMDADTVAESVADSARFSIYDLVDEALQGRVARALRMLNGLRAEGEEPVLVLWALSREVRSLATMAQDLATGSTMDQTLQRHRVWERRKPIVRQGLKRHRVAAWRVMLRQCARADRVIKGAEPGSPWDELLQLSMKISGVAV